MSVRFAKLFHTQPTCRQSSLMTFSKFTMPHCRRLGQIFVRSFYSSASYFIPNASPKLSPQQVNAYIRLNEQSIIGEGAVKSFDCNRLPANNPIEDRDASAKLKNSKTGQYLFGVFDGHGGDFCSQAVCERLYNYISVTMSPPEVLDVVRKANYDINTLVDWLHGPQRIFTDVMDSVYKAKLAKLASEILSLSEETTIKENLISAFNSLDHDLMSEAAPTTLNRELQFNSMHMAFQGSCACVAMLDDTDLYIANTGDCRAVLGVQDEDGWNALPLSQMHDAANPSEIRRLLQVHPNERANMIQQGRLFGILAPLRAFGDAQFKWSARDLKHVEKTSAYDIPIYGKTLIPRGYQTPPYVTAEPEVIHHTLTPKDKFLIIASDGLWEQMPAEKVVQLVGGHNVGHQVPVNFQPSPNMTLKDINEALKKRQDDLKQKPQDDNVCSYLLRHALGPEHQRISETLSLAPGYARFYRDDISIIVVHFDSEYIKDRYVT
ncbi:pyruvate dehydrogenase [acetyl-transferring]-phosphatase 1, mitochondrial-like [Ylistrum balloti]|uniref:pyruvate dehydrogenase [acetyl-transferring]-phosphatase 1, mitochondrial-like n=1 Tax=Ylistrum balloti TaxID=509963 RepID=UPI00290590A1|nr:pyruvate dehydrogenase [acetyl-transferring]-phosphatase 1, mitochondrial-like [Ylistrum balloti]